jgi:hypothetical protein
MNTEITNKNTSIFDTKEQYLAFRAMWKQLHSDGFHKPQPEPQVIYDYAIKDTRVVGYHKASPMNVAYHVAFNVALGRDLSRIFAKDSGGDIQFSGAHSALWVINSRQHSDKFFAVFGAALTPEQRIAIQTKVTAFLKTL